MRQKLTALKTAAPLFLIATTLTGCAGFSGFKQQAKPAEIQAPAIPAELILCISQLTPMPGSPTLNKTQALKLISALRISEVSKKLCGERLIELYEKATAE